MSTNTYNTANLDNQQWAQMATLIGNDMRSGQAFSVTGPMANQMLSAATAQSGVAVSNASTAAQPVIADPATTAPQSTMDWILDTLASGGGASSVAAGPAEQAAAAGANDATTAAAAGGYASPDTTALTGATSSDSFVDWLQSHMANVGLVILGALLVLGALLISQRNNVETVIKTVGKVAEVAG